MQGSNEEQNKMKKISWFFLTGRYTAQLKLIHRQCVFAPAQSITLGLFNNWAKWSDMLLFLPVLLRKLKSSIELELLQGKLPNLEVGIEQ